MAVLRWFKGLFQRVTADSVSCGSLAIWALAIGSLIVAMQFFVKNQLL
jgi:hypothetical protein